MKLEKSVFNFLLFYHHRNSEIGENEIKIIHMQIIDNHFQTIHLEKIIIKYYNEFLYFIHEKTLF